MTSPADYRRRAQLSWRIRAYVAVLAIRHIGFALALVSDRRLLRSSPSFRYLFEVIPPAGWAWLYGLLGVAALGGIVRPKEAGIRLLVILSVGLSCAWAAGCALSWVLGPPAPAGLAVVAFVAFALKDLIVAGMVYVNPIEQLVAGVRADEADAQRRREERARRS